MEVIILIVLLFIGKYFKVVEFEKKDGESKITIKYKKLIDKIKNLF